MPKDPLLMRAADEAAASNAKAEAREQMAREGRYVWTNEDSARAAEAYGKARKEHRQS